MVHNFQGPQRQQINPGGDKDLLRCGPCFFNSENLTVLRSLL